VGHGEDLVLRDPPLPVLRGAPLVVAGGVVDLVLVVVPQLLAQGALVGAAAGLELALVLAVGGGRGDADDRGLPEAAAHDTLPCSNVVRLRCLRRLTI
jgi:hypothetical protein